MHRRPGPGTHPAHSRHGPTPEPPVVRARAATAAAFLRRHRLPPEYADALDLRADVRETTLNPGLHLIAYHAGPLPGAASWNPFGLFYTEVDAAVRHHAQKPDPRLYARYIVVTAAPALRFRAAHGARTHAKAPTYLASGNGWQYIVPGAAKCLRRL